MLVTNIQFRAHFRKSKYIHHKIGSEGPLHPEKRNEHFQRSGVAGLDAVVGDRYNIIRLLCAWIHMFLLIFRCMRTTKVQTRIIICAVWSETFVIRPLGGILT